MSCRLLKAGAVLEEVAIHLEANGQDTRFTAEGSPKLLDFGLAHAVDDAAIPGGTLPYLSPEVLAGRATEETDDVWSLCVVLDEMVSGRDSRDRLAKCFQIICTLPVRFSLPIRR